MRKNLLSGGVGGWPSGADLQLRWLVMFGVLCAVWVTVATGQGSDPTFVADPVLKASPGSGSQTYSVTVTDTTPGVSIYYTTNGTNPTTSSSSVTSGGSVTVNQNALLKVQAYLGTSGSSDLVTGSYAANGLITSGSQHALVLTGSGTIWAWGNNSLGQLGIGGTASWSQPVQVSLSGATPIVSLTSVNIPYQNGLSIPWQIKFFGTTGNNPAATSSALDGYSILQECQLNRNPNDYYQGVPPALDIIEGNGQTGALGSFLPQPLVVEVANGAGVDYANAPVTFSVTSGGGGISLSGSGSTSSVISTRTDSGGMAEVYFQFPATASGADTIQVTAGTASPVSFTESLPAANTPQVGLVVNEGTTAPATLALTSTASVGVTQVAFYEGSELLGTAKTSPYTINLSQVGAGLHTYTAVATNFSGVTGQTSANYTVNLANVAPSQYRFTRGTGTNQTFLSSIIAVDFEQGLLLDGTGSNAEKFPAGLPTPWFMQISDEENTIYHITSVSGTVGYTLPFQNPLVAFGQSTGGAPLYTNQSYGFGVAAGGQIGLSGSNGVSEIEIEVYSKTNQNPDQFGRQSPIATAFVTLPQSGTPQWTALAKNGYVADLHLTGSNDYYTNSDGSLGVLYNNYFGQPIDFDTQIQFVAGTSPEAIWNQTTEWALLLTHRSASSAYEYKINYLGSTLDTSGTLWAMAADNPSNPNFTADYNVSYTLDFTDRPAWVSTSLSEPSFQGQALPSQYAGQSIQELLNVSSPVTYQFPTFSGTALTPYTSLDNSPELRTDPILDKFVSDMGYNPITLTNYVLNQIQLTDAVSYSGTVPSSDTSVNLGGVNRGALATFEEKEGSPTEQCALLIYFLRSCGIPCGYVFPPTDSLQMLNARMSTLLRMQLNGAVNPSGSNSIVPQLLYVNYPWVTAYINGQWVHIFPWLKDTSITEGYDLDDYLPQGYQTGLHWLQAYINRDNSLLPAGTTWSTVEQDNPGYLYPLWLDQQLAAAGLDENDIGVTIVDRPHNYNTWSDLPQPWQVTTTGFSTANLYSSLSQFPAVNGIPGIFDTIECVTYSDQNNSGEWVSPEPMLDTGALPSLYLHNRRLMVMETQTGFNTHNMTMSLEAFRPGTSATNNYSSGDLVNAQTITVGLTATDSLLKFRLIYNRHRTLPSSYFVTNNPANPLGPTTSPSTPDPWSTFMGVTDVEQIVDERPFTKGDAITLCLDFGRVTQDMLNAKAQDFWTAQQAATANGNTMDTNSATGAPLFLVGMSYYKHVSDFRDQVEGWEKQTTVSFFASGLSKMSPQRNADGTLPGLNLNTYIPSSPPPGDGYNVIGNIFINITGTGGNEILIHTSGTSLSTQWGWSWAYASSPNLIYSDSVPNDGYVLGNVPLISPSNAGANAVTFLGPPGIVVFPGTIPPGNVVFTGTIGDIGILTGSNSGFVQLSGTNVTPEGEINLLYPNVDMHFQRMATAFNGTLHPNSGIPESTVVNDWLYLLIGEVSAQEHTVLNQFFNLKDTASTINLLHDTQVQGKQMILLNSTNYLTYADSNPSAPTFADPNPARSSTKKTLQDWAGAIWTTATNTLASTGSTANPVANFAQVYITPGPIVSADNSYEGVGAMVLNPGAEASALISTNMISAPINGGYAEEWDADAGYSSSIYDTPPVIQASTISVNTAGDYSLTLAVAPGRTDTISGDGALFQAPTTISEISTGADTLDAGALASVSQDSTLLGGGQITVNSSGATIANALNAALNLGDVGPTVYQGQNSSTTVEPVDVVTGAFYVNDTDLVIPGPMPITVTRNYTSLNLAQTEFGYGWKLGYFPYLVVSNSNNLIYAAEMDGDTVAYRQKSGSTTVWTPQPGDNPQLVNQSGGAAGSIFNLYNNSITMTGSGANATYTLNGADGSARKFVVTSYPLTSGTTTVSRQRPYLQTWTDSKGNYLTFTFGSTNTNPDWGLLNRITASNGNFVQLDYDIYGHILSINAGDGRLLTYSYDSYQDLTSVTLPDNSTINYTYNHLANTGTNTSGFYSQHLISQETKPEGRILTNQYDALRRVTLQQASVGANNALVTSGTITYSGTTTNTDGTWTGSTIIKDANNQPTQYNYTESQITKITDQLNQTIQQTWYTTTGSGGYQRSLWTRTDKRGLLETFKYDSNGNVIEQDSTGNLTGSGNSTAVTTGSYNSLNLPVRMTQPNNDYKTYTYNSPISPYLATAIQNYAANGTLMSETDNTYGTAGSTGTAPFACGVLTQTSRGIPGSVDYSTVTYTYGNNGFPTSETDATGMSDPAVTYSLTYNLRGQLIQKTDAAGRSTEYAYDDLGHPIWTQREDKNGNLLGWNYKYYNQNGDIEWTEGSRYNPVDYTETLYDGGGRLQQHLVWRSEASDDGSGVEEASGSNEVATTTYTHNAFGDLTQIMDSRGDTRNMGYDYLGQMTSGTTVDVSGSTLAIEAYQHEPGGKVSVYTNPRNGITHYYYTQTGQLQEQDNPDGSTLRWSYQLDGRRSTETLANGSIWSYAYNDAARTVAGTLKDSSGNVLDTNSQSSDSRGNMNQQVDGEGYATNTVFDGLNRVKVMTGPPAGDNYAQQQSRHTYDAAGFTEVSTDALGESSVTSFDALGRPVQVQVNSATGTTVRSKGYEYSPDHQAVTEIDGSKTDVRTTYTDLQGKPVLLQKADGSFVLSVYDTAENLVSTTDEMGRITSFSYDGLNRKTLQILPDGGKIQFGYDAAGNLTSRQMPGQLVWTGTYDNASRILSEKLTQSGSTTRSYSYNYYTSNGNGGIVGKLASITDPRGIVTTITYDSFGREQQRAAVDPSGAQLGVTLAYGYDRRNLLTQVNETYQNGSVSPPVSVLRGYDGYGDLSNEQVYLSGTLKDNWQEIRDGAGRRTGLTELDNTSLPYTYSYRADGLMAGMTFNGSAYTYSYGFDGLLTQRSTPWHTQNIVSRDAVGRITEETQSTSSGTFLDEKNIAWRGDSTQGSFTANRNGAGAWNETRNYSYDDNSTPNQGRGRLLGETFAPSASGTAALGYQFDNGQAGGLGLLTSVTLSGALSGSDTQTFGTFARLGGLSTTGVLTGTLGTPLSVSFDAVGQTGTFQGSTATDKYTWDAMGRLVGVARLNSASSGFTWTAVYDGLGRRQQTTQQTVTGGSPTGIPLLIQSSYDPDSRYMEAAVTVNGQRDWLVHGPDLDGIFGGLQGIGGIEEVYGPSNGIQAWMASDICGHVEATVAAGNSVTWSSAHCDGYGALPGSVALPVDATHDVSTVLAWHGRYIDPTGLYYLGGRYYNPQSGTFLSADPLGQDASLSLYDYCAGDPVNRLDPLGTCGVENPASDTLNAQAQSLLGNNNDYTSTSESLSGALSDIGRVLSGNFEPLYGSGAPEDNQVAVNYIDATTPDTDVSQSDLQSVSDLLNAVPLVGAFKGLTEVATGSDLLTGQQVSTAQAATSAVLGTLALLPFGELGEAGELAEGEINYGALDSLGRPTGVTATLTPDMIGTGTPANPNIFPPGWSGNGNVFNEARGHLLGAQLGGSGDVAENLVTLQQNPANSPVMRDFETSVRSAVEGGQVVQYSSTPIYNGNNLVPRGITLSAQGSSGFNLYVTVLNPL